jgi:hypothetical protein
MKNIFISFLVAILIFFIFGYTEIGKTNYIAISTLFSLFTAFFIQIYNKDINDISFNWSKLGVTAVSCIIFNLLIYFLYVK